MKRKLVAFALVFAMLISLSLAVTAGAVSEPPTIEEILDEYHQKAFEEQTRGNTETASTWSRRGDNGTTLEQETVDILTDAGYEAYNVTADNFEYLEAALNTDFAGMGLDPNESYIIVIHGEDQEDATSYGDRSTFGFRPEQEQAPDGGGESFTHTYNNQVYTMRYVTVTSTTSGSSSGMSITSAYTLEPEVWYEDAVMDGFSTALVSAADAVSGNFVLGTIGELLFGFFVDDNYTELEPNTLTIHAGTIWTASNIQVWNASFERWDTAQCSAYAVSRARCAGYLIDPVENDLIWYDGTEYSNKTYSPKCNLLSWRKDEAARAYISGQISYDRTGDINFFLGDKDGEILYVSEKKPLFTHIDGWLTH